MAKKKEKIDTDFDSIKQFNEENFKTQLKFFRPDIFVLMDILDNTRVNPLVVYQMIRHLNSIAMGNKYGKVVAEIENGTCTFVRGEESTKLNEKLILSLNDRAIQ